MKDIDRVLDKERLVAFTQKLIQTPSLSMEEKEIASVIQSEMQALAYDEVWVDDLYNVVGVIKGARPGPTLLFNGHIDHAGVGEMIEPFSAKRMPGESLGYAGEVIYGRGGVDMKGAVASMTQAGGLIKKMGIELAGDLIVTCVSREEMARGEGILRLLNNGMTADFAVSGEASNLQIKLGHRGKWEARVSTIGKTTHGGNPEGGVNAIFQMNKFLNALQEEYPLPEHEFLGKATVTVLDINASPGALSPIVPDRCEAIVDRRFLPGESEAHLLGEIRTILRRLQERDSNFKAEVETNKWFPAMFTPPEEPIVQAMLDARRKVMGEAGEMESWYFGVDGTFISQAGIPCVGFGPGDEYLAHTPREVLPIQQLIASCRVYAQLVSDLLGGSR